MAETDWAGLLQAEDVEGLWNALYRLISRHPAVRPLRFPTEDAAVSSQLEINADLTQEVFLELFQKQRFDHYLNNDYTSTAIENEITHIELPNLVGARLRKRYPESFRMARRVSSLLKSSSSFRRFTPGGGRTRGAGNGGRNGGSGRKPAAAAGAQPLDGQDGLPDSYGFEDPGEQPATPAPRRQRMVNQIYGLRHWPATKRMGDSGHFSEMARSVAMRRRDTRVVGRSGSSQLILSNSDLEALIVEIFSAIDSPADVKTMRQLTLSKIPLQDYAVASLDEGHGTPDGSSSSGHARSAGSGKHVKAYAVSSNGGTPESDLLEEEQRRATESLAEDFLNRLRRGVNNNPQRYDRLMRTLWFCYYDPEEPSQLQIAKKLGVSDSLVSDNRKLIEYELKKLGLSVEDGPVFSEAVRRLVKEVLSAEC